LGAVNTAQRLTALAILLACLAPATLPGKNLARAQAPGFSAPDPSALFSRTAAQTLARNFSSPNISYLFYDAQDGTFIASKWRSPAQPVPVGSLVKPFTALAYAETHAFRFPEHVCTGSSTCWLASGHGKLGIVAAIAQSCNSYFTALAADTGASQVTSLARRFGLSGPGVNASAEAMAGQFGVWRESPENLVRAYAMLLDRASQPAIHDIVNGMAESARVGTAAALSRPGLHQRFLAKTGTAPCTHRAHAAGDGFVLVAWPADLPRYLLLVRQHGAPGAQASVLAGRMLRTMEP
jgi:cell division protein FtsI/penicillin-binding protein 2